MGAWRRMVLLTIAFLLVFASVMTLSSCGERKLDLTDYTITYPYGVSDEVFGAILDLREAVKEATGVKLKYNDDFVNEKLGDTVPTDTKEILIGRTNRAESGSHELGRDDTAIYFENDRLVITGGSDAAIVEAIKTYIAEYIDGATMKAPRRAVITRAEDPYEKVTLGGESIYKYCIVYTTETQTIAKRLQAEIANASGAVLDMYPASKDTGTDREILLGDFLGERATTAVASGYRVEMLGNRLSLRGAGKDGAYAAMMAFIGDLAGSGKKLTLSYDTAKTGAVTDMSFFTLNLNPTFGDMTDKYDVAFSTETVMERFLATKDELPEEVTVIDRVSLDDYPLSMNNVVYVSTSGDDKAAGTQEAPLKTLEAALERMKNAGGGVIFMMGGTYSVKDTVRMTEAHSGSRQAPLFIKALDGADVKITSQKPLDVSDGKWEYVDASDSIHAAIYDRIPEEARDNLVYTTLEWQGMSASDIPAITKSGPGRMYVGGEEYQLAQYPNKTIDPNELLYFNVVYDQGKVTGTSTNLYPSWQQILAQNGWAAADEHGWEIRVPNTKDGGKNHDPKGDEMAAEILSWVNTGDIWYYGSTFEGWEFGYYNLALTTTEHGVTTHWAHTANGEQWAPGKGTPYLGSIKHGWNQSNAGDGYYSLKSKTANRSWGAKQSANSAAGRNTFYLFNAIEALDAPGEWYYEKTTGVLYLYPKAAHEDLKKSGPAFSNPTSFTTLEAISISNVVFDGLTFDGASKRGLHVKTSDAVIVQNCIFKNSADTNMTLEKSTNCAVIYSDFSMAYNTMLSISDTTSTYQLVPCGNVIQNNVFHDPAPLEQVGVGFGGCRLVVSHNYFNNTTCVGGNGVECIIEYNLFEGGSKDVTDGGMIYASGSSCRANHYRYNMFHMFNATHNAVYNDTMGSGNYMYYNIVSTLHSKSDPNKPWYSSTGWGNVSYGNLTILRTPNELRDAGSNATQESEGFANAQEGDVFNESGLFYYYFSDAHGAGGTAAQYVPVDYNGNRQFPVTYDAVNKTYSYTTLSYLTQSLAGHWWQGYKKSDTKTYLSTVDVDAWAARMPEYINMLYGTKLIVDLYADVASETPDLAGRVQDFHIKYFYIPWYLATDEDGSRKTYTYAGRPDDAVITIPEYTYLVEAAGGNGFKTVTVPEHIHDERNDDGSITLTYEEIAAMERARRAPQYSVVSNNIVLGSSPKYEEGWKDGKKTLFPIDESDPAAVVTNTTVGITTRNKEVQARGLMITTEVKDNFMVYDYSLMMPGAYTFNYSMTDAAWEGIRSSNTVDGEVIDILEELSTSLYDKCGPTYSSFDATMYFDTVYPDFDWDAYPDFDPDFSKDEVKKSGFYWLANLLAK